MSKVQFNISDSIYEYNNEQSSPAGCAFRGFNFSQTLASAMSSVVHSYDYPEDVYVTIGGSTVTFTSVTERNVITIAVVRNSLESFSITEVAHGNVSARMVDGFENLMHGITNGNTVDDFFTIAYEVCKEIWM